MTRVKLVMMILAMVSLLGACKKEGPAGPTGPQGPQGPSGPQAKTYNFSLTYAAGETFQSYAGIVSDFDADDVVLVYIFWANYGDDYYVQLPMTAASGTRYFAEMSEVDGFLFVNAVSASGGSPFASSTTLGFKAVLIKSAAFIANPDVDWGDYEEVANRFKLD